MPLPSVAAAALQNPGLGLPILLLSIYVFLVYSRAPELIGLILGNVRLPMIIALLISIACVLNRRFPGVVKSRASVALLFFTVWLAFAVTTSVWRSESARLVVLQWPLQVATFYCAATLISTVKDCYRIAKAMTLGVLFIVIIQLTLGASIYGRATVSIAGTLSNPNLLALQLLMGMPLCLAPIYRHGFFSLWGAISSASLLIGLYVVGTTGSRSGLIALIAGLCILFMRGSLMTKAKLVILSALFGLVMTMILPTAVRMRYLTVLTDPEPEDTTTEIRTAIDSTRARQRHLRQSIDLTIRHPLLGVGPGQFKVAAANDAEKKSARADWLETHNTFTQISSEAGIPALIAYLALIIVPFRRLWKLYRRIRRIPQMAYVSDICFALLLSMTLMLITANFASVAYQTYFPLLCGLATALTRAGDEAAAMPASPAPRMAGLGMGVVNPVGNSVRR